MVDGKLEKSLFQLCREISRNDEVEMSSQDVVKLLLNEARNSCPILDFDFLDSILSEELIEKIFNELNKLKVWRIEWFGIVVRKESK